jgi:hypothetical protein
MSDVVIEWNWEWLCPGEIMRGSWNGLEARISAKNGYFYDRVSMEGGARNARYRTTGHGYSGGWDVAKEKCNNLAMELV